MELRASNSKEAVSELNSLGVFASEIREPKIEPKQVRSAYNLSQSDFATMYGFELDTLQNWEQGRNPPDFIARVFLKIIQRNPHLVMQILTEGENLSWPGNQIGTRRYVMGISDWNSGQRSKEKLLCELCELFPIAVTQLRAVCGCSPG